MAFGRNLIVAQETPIAATRWYVMHSTAAKNRSVLLLTGFSGGNGQLPHTSDTHW
jgi:hypothetical protein